MEKLGKEYDVVIIGGGITGAGILRDCAMRGLKVLLLEKGDFGGVTTMNSSLLIHSGLRYIKDDWNETKTCAIECGYVERIARPFLERIVFLMPFFKGEKIDFEITDMGLEACDFIGKDRFTNPHIRLTGKEALRLIPELRKDVIGALTFEEWEISPQEFVRAHIESAKKFFGAEAERHMEVIGFILKNGVVSGVMVQDTGTKKSAIVWAKIVVNATGPWSGKTARLAGIDFKLRPTKGIHLMLDIPIKYGFALKAIDNRHLLAQPRENKLLIGTTDDDYYGDLDDLKTTADEEGYILEALERVMPGKSKAPIIKKMVGIRPTIWQWGKTEDKVSRRFVVIDHGATDGLEGLITVCGGKMTIYRVMAEKTVDIICRKLGINKPCQTHLVKLLNPTKIRQEEKWERRVRKYYDTSFILNKKTLPSAGLLIKIQAYGFLALFSIFGLLKKLTGKNRKGLKYIR